MGAKVVLGSPVPVRFIAEGLGSDVKWSSKARAVTITSAYYL